MNEEKEKQIPPLLSALFAIGLAFLILGIVTRDAVHVFSGVVTVGGSVALYFVKKKDWKKHWEEHELVQKSYRARQRAEKEKKDAEREQR